MSVGAILVILLLMAKKNFSGAWVVAVDMGYGHQRSAYPLRYLSFDGRVINANSYEGIKKEDRFIWQASRTFYEFVSNFKKIPFIGEAVFSAFNKIQAIGNFYPRRDLSEPNLQLKLIYYLFKKGWGKHLIDQLAIFDKGIKQAGGSKFPPIITTFFTVAFMAEYFNYPGEIYCIICDADIARVWAPFNPPKSRIKYCAPNTRVVDRLQLYGIRNENIFKTGYPLPLENVGTVKTEILRSDLTTRIFNLDPQKKHLLHYKDVVKKTIGRLPKVTNRILTLTFSVGGAGAQKEIGLQILKSLSSKIKNGKIKIMLAAGSKEEVKEYFIKGITLLGLGSQLNKGIEIIFEKNITEYFAAFNKALRNTDVLWTKPSELSFYTGLGLPIIMSPTIGSQEEFNKDWLKKIGAAFTQEDPNCVDQWFFDWLETGWFAEAAIHGFVEAEKIGVLNIEKIVKK